MCFQRVLSTTNGGFLRERDTTPPLRETKRLSLPRSSCGRDTCRRYMNDLYTRKTLLLKWNQKLYFLQWVYLFSMVCSISPVISWSASYKNTTCTFRFWSWLVLDRNLIYLMMSKPPNTHDFFFYLLGIRRLPGRKDLFDGRCDCLPNLWVSLPQWVSGLNDQKCFSAARIDECM